MSYYLDTVIKDVIDMSLDEIKKEETLEKFKHHIIDPTMCYIMDKFYPYIIILNLIVTLMLVMMGFLIYSTFKSANKSYEDKKVGGYTNTEDDT